VRRLDWKGPLPSGGGKGEDEERHSKEAGKRGYNIRSEYDSEKNSYTDKDQERKGRTNARGQRKGKVHWALQATASFWGLGGGGCGGGCGTQNGLSTSNEGSEGPTRKDRDKAKVTQNQDTTSKGPAQREGWMWGEGRPNEKRPDGDPRNKYQRQAEDPAPEKEEQKDRRGKGQSKARGAVFCDSSENRRPSEGRIYQKLSS